MKSVVIKSVTRVYKTNCGIYIYRESFDKNGNVHALEKLERDAAGTNRWRTIARGEMITDD